MSTAELQRAQEKAVSTATDKEANKPVVNNYTAPAPKPTSKQPKGIMGMFSSKAAPKSEEQSKEVKKEQIDNPPSVSNQSLYIVQSQQNINLNNTIFLSRSCSVWPSAVLIFII